MGNTRDVPLTPDEEIILYGKGGYKKYVRSGWNFGHFYLTNNRLLFSRPPGMVFEVPLNHITTIKVERQKFVLRIKDVMCISYMDRTKRASKIWIIMSNLEIWRRKLFELSLLNIHEETIDDIARMLDEESQTLLWYLWENKHAKIDELAELIDGNHMDVLLRIRDVINPTAESKIGNPILIFERSRMDPETGEKILFSWWLAGQRTEKKKTHIPLDIFDEGSHINVITELPGLSENSLSLKIKDFKLFISARVNGELHEDEVIFPCQVDTERYIVRYNNGILLIVLEKRQQECTTSNRNLKY